MSSTNPHATPQIQDRGPYPAGVPKRFSLSGEVQHWPGNTCICPIGASTAESNPPEDRGYSEEDQGSYGGQNAFPPPSSWHMTVLDCVNDENRAPGWWPPGKEQQPIEECTAEFTERLRPVIENLENAGLAPPYHMRVEGFDKDNRPDSGIALKISAASDEEEKRLRSLRDVLADGIGFRNLRHESYEWHVGLVYFLAWMNEEEGEELRGVLEGLIESIQGAFVLEELQFTDFETLHEFRRILGVGGEN